MKTDRYHLIDTLRGFALINMFVYHTLWSMANLFGHKIEFLNSLPAYLWQQSGASLFILLSGFCWALTHKHLKRSLVVLGCAFFIFVCTFLFNKSNVINFGIIAFMGSAMLLMVPLAKMLRHLPPKGGLFLSLLLFFACKNITHGSIGIGAWQIALPHEFYANYFTAWLGLPPPGFHSADYFPILPWLFMYTAGYFIYHACSEYITKSAAATLNIPPLSLLGRHSLAAYLIHQPVIIALLWVWDGAVR